MPALSDSRVKGFNDKLFKRWKEDEAILFLGETALLNQVLAASLAARNLIPDSTKIFDFLKDEKTLNNMFKLECSASVYNSSDRLDALGAMSEGIEKSARNTPNKDAKEIAANICRAIEGLVNQQRELYQQLDNIADLVA